MFLSNTQEYPGVMTYRSRRRRGAIHVAVRWQGKSLCGLDVPQAVWRPERADPLCGSCRRCLRAMGIHSERGA